jgi:hypothetical protein
MLYGAVLSFVTGTVLGSRTMDSFYQSAGGFALKQPVGLAYRLLPYFCQN